MRRVAVVEGDPVTLVCGTDLTGNPLPLIVWRDNNAMSVFGMEGERNRLLLILTVIALLRCLWIIRAVAVSGEVVLSSC